MVRIHSGVPVFYHLAAFWYPKRPLRPFAQPEFRPDIVHFVQVASIGLCRILRRNQPPKQRNPSQSKTDARRTTDPTMPGGGAHLIRTRSWLISGSAKAQRIAWGRAPTAVLSLGEQASRLHSPRAARSAQ